MMYRSDSDDEIVRDRIASSPDASERLVVGVGENIVASPGPRPIEDFSFADPSDNLFADAGEEPVTAAIIMAEAFQQTPFDPVEPYLGMRIRGRAEDRHRLQGLSIHSTPTFRKKISATEKTHEKFRTWFKDHSTIIKKRDDLNIKAKRFYNELILEIIKYCHHLYEEPTTQRSYDTYLSCRADVVKSLQNGHSLIYPMVIKSVRRADHWSRTVPSDQ
ncbi:hypothetical protein EDC96DRAFT_550169 [Choanephora cucurbitarum]|nr:hypothetical protein EDC96DRAFT_550169 [Choanephora cucurbitarum]